MASFLDQVTGFTAYQQEMPVDALSSVGMYKENMFNQGIQQVQANVNELAALPIARTVGQNYMNQKIDQLKGTLSNSLSSDFSDQRLVTQIGGLTKQIGADPVVQHEVQNTLAMQGMDKQVAKDRTDGKVNPANTGVYQMDRNAWLNDTDLNADFTANYYTPVDYNKNALETFKAISGNPNLTEADIPFKRDAATGQVLRDKSGKPVLDEVMVREKYSGVSPDRIKQALMATFDESAVNQLNIEGRWHYRGADANSMYHVYADRITNQIQDYTNEINTLKAKKLEKGADLDGIQQTIEQYQNQIRQQQDQLNQIHPDDIANNLEAFKGKVYTSDYLNTFSNAFAFSNKTSQLLENPYQSYRLNVDRSNREWATLGETRRHNMADEGIAGRNADISAARLSWEMTKPGAVKGQWGQGITFNGTTPVGNEGDAFTALNSDIMTIDTNLKGIKDNVITSSADVQGSTPAEREKFLEDRYDEYNQKGILPQSPDLINYIKQRKILERDKLTKQQLAKDANNFAYQQAETTDIGRQLSGLIGNKTYHLNTPHYGNIDYSPTEIKQLLERVAKVKQNNGPGLNNTSLGYVESTYVDPRSVLSEKERIFYDHMVNGGNNNVTGQIKQFYDKNYGNIGNNVDIKSSKVNEYINKHTDQYLNKAGGIALPDEASRQSFASDLNALFIASGRTDNNTETISKWATDKNTTFSITKDGTLTASNKGDVKQIKLSVGERTDFFGTDFSNPYDKIQQVITHFGGTTNTAGIYANAENAYFQSFDMNPSILTDKYSGRVKADVSLIPNTNQYKIKVWYYNPDAKSSDKWQGRDIFQKDGTGYNIQSAYQYITSGIGDNTIESIFNK